MVELRFRVDLLFRKSNTCISEQLRTIAQIAKTPIAPSLDTKTCWFMKHCNGYLPFFVMVSRLWITGCGIPSGLLAVECWLWALLMDIPDYGFRAVKLWLEILVCGLLAKDCWLWIPT